MKVILISTMLILLWSCNGNSTKKEHTKMDKELIETENEKINLKQTKHNSNDIELKAKKEHKIVQEEFSDLEVEKKRIETELNIYTNAILVGDVDLAYKYVYKDIYKSINEQYGSNYDESEAKKMFEESLSFVKEYEDMGVSLRFKFKDFIKHVDKDGYIIYSVTTTLIAERDDTKFSEDGKQLAISINNGKNWQFIDKKSRNEYLPILKVSIPSHIAELVE